MNRPLTSIIASCSGSFIEWYDFVLFIYLTPVMNHSFFYFESDPFKGLLYVLFIFAVGSLARPIGAIIFGHMGDRYGRAKTLQLIILLMSCISLLIAALPNYHKIGIYAPIILFILRIGQGLCVGGEFSGSIVYLGESSKAHQRGFFTSMINTGANFGAVISIVIVTILSHAMPYDAFIDIGWRIAYVIGALFGLLGLLTRFRLRESPLFKQLTHNVSLAKFPIKSVFAKQKKPFFIISVQLILSAVGSYTIAMYLSTYLHIFLHFRLKDALAIQTYIMLITLVLIPCFAYLSDKVGRRNLLATVCIGYIVLAYPCFYYLDQSKQWLWILPLVFFYCMEQGTTPATVVEHFPIENRYSGIALSYNLVMSIVGGFTPLVITWLLHRTLSNIVPAYYIMAFAAAVLLNVIFGLRKTYGAQADLSA